MKNNLVWTLDDCNGDSGDNVDWNDAMDEFPQMIRICSFSLYFYLDRLTGLYRCEFVYGKEIDILSKFHVDETFYNDEIAIWPLFH